ncbi:MAG TPA: PilT/PilU family type 4a pilus ATPase [Kofleriaceae bacterium]
MGALDQLLAYFDREEVTEIVIATGRPIAVRKGGAYVALTATPLTREQLGTLLEGTSIALPPNDGMQPPEDLAVAHRPVRVQVGRRGAEIVVRIERGPVNPARTATHTPHIAKEPPAHAARTTRAPRSTKAPPIQPAGTTTGTRNKRPSAPLELDDAELEVEPPPAQAPAPKPATSRVPVVAAKSAALDQLVATARARGASDLHVAAGRPVMVRVGGELVAIDPAAPPLATAAAEAMLLAVLAPVHKAQLASVGYADLAIDLAGGGRLRANISGHQGGLKGAFRIARAAPPTLDELGLPASLSKVIAHHQGLVVIAGPSGQGKTTTLAALVDQLNASKPCHILTIEDPIEIVYARKAAVVSQREAGLHTKTFATGLKASLREDPDVIVIGELRDRETVEIALTAAETGHLVLSTMSTPSAAKTIDRLVDMFPAEEHAQVRASIAGALRAIVAQRLLPAVGGGVVPAVELVTGVLPLAVLIREDKLYQLPNLMQRGKAFGMLRFEDSLAELVAAGKIASATAQAALQVRR